MAKRLDRLEKFLAGYSQASEKSSPVQEARDTLIRPIQLPSPDKDEKPNLQGNA